MAVITFTSDFGWRDHYVAAVKARVLAFNQNIRIIDVTHEIEPHNITQTSYILKNVFRDFPIGTVHLVGVNSWDNRDETKLIALRLEEHYFVGFDNGLFSLISSKKPMVICELNYDKSNLGSFSEKTIMANAAAQLATGASVYDLGKQVMSIKQLLVSTAFRSQNEIIGQVVHIDSYGNIISNINPKEMELEANLSESSLVVGRHHISYFSNFISPSHGDSFAFVNSNGQVCIGIKCGNACKLLGVKIGQEVRLLMK